MAPVVVVARGINSDVESDKKKNAEIQKRQKRNDVESNERNYVEIEKKDYAECRIQRKYDDFESDGKNNVESDESRFFVPSTSQFFVAFDVDIFSSLSSRCFCRFRRPRFFIVFDIVILSSFFSVDFNIIIFRRFRCRRKNYDVKATKMGVEIDKKNADIGGDIKTTSKLQKKLCRKRRKKRRRRKAAKGAPHRSQEPKLQLYDGRRLASTEQERDLGVLVDGSLRFHSQASSAAAKGNQLLGIVRRAFASLTNTSLPLLYKSLIRPHLKFGNCIWGPMS